MSLLKKIISSFAGAYEYHRFSNVRNYCFFLGYSRSGHSLIGALLDAHPSIALAHELNVLDLIQKNYTYRQILYLIGRNARMHARRGRNWEGYSYRVPGQFQGERRNLLVIGDKKGGTSANLLVRHPELLSKLKKTIPLPIKVVHVVRNPFDMVATRVLKNRRNRKVEEVTHQFLAQARLVERIRPHLDIIDVSLEDFIRNPGIKLTEIIDFLEVPVNNQYLKDCCSIVLSTPRITREQIKWPAEVVNNLNREIREIPSLSHYTFQH